MIKSLSFRNLIEFILLVTLSFSGGANAFAPRSGAFTSAAFFTSRRSSKSALWMNGPAVLDGPATIEKADVEKDEKTEQDSKLGGEAFEIRLFNDPFNKREFVARCLSTVCGKSDTESYQIMMEAHNNGMGVVGRYQFEIAELYHNSLRENGLMVDMVQVDDE